MVLHFGRRSDRTTRLCALVQVALEASFCDGLLLEVGGHWVRVEVIAGHDDRLRNGLVQPFEDLNRDEGSATTPLTIILSLAEPACPPTPDTNTPRLLLTLLASR